MRKSAGNWVLDCGVTMVWETTGIAKKALWKSGGGSSAKYHCRLPCGAWLRNSAAHVQVDAAPGSEEPSAGGVAIPHAAGGGGAFGIPPTDSSWGRGGGNHAPGPSAAFHSPGRYGVSSQ